MTPALDVIAIGGAPATGKSTLVQRALREYDAFTRFEWGTCKGRLYDNAPLIVLGRYGPDRDFGGTDALAMNAITDTKDFIDTAATDDQYAGYTVLFEGDRLYNEAFLTYCQNHDHVDLTAWLLTAADDVLARRHDKRDDDQSDSWLAGRETKYDNLHDNPDIPTSARDNTSTTALGRNTDALLDLLPTPTT